MSAAAIDKAAVARARAAAGTLRRELAAVGWEFPDLSRPEGEWPGRVARSERVFTEAMKDLLHEIARSDGLEPTEVPFDGWIGITERAYGLLREE
ncbi:hypothetical protein GCM10022221_57250 [Actinocorallia aurea]